MCSRACVETTFQAWSMRPGSLPRTLVESAVNLVTISRKLRRVTSWTKKIGEVALQVAADIWHLNFVWVTCPRLQKTKPMIKEESGFRLSYSIEPRLASPQQKIMTSIAQEAPSVTARVEKGTCRLKAVIRSEYEYTSWSKKINLFTEEWFPPNFGVHVVLRMIS